MMTAKVGREAAEYRMEIANRQAKTSGQETMSQINKCAAEEMIDVVESLEAAGLIIGGLKGALTRLVEKVERANNIRHSGGKLTNEDWAELYQISNEARKVLSE